MRNQKLVKKLTNPYNITLFRNGENKNIYYYFTWNKKMYRGSTGTSDLNDSINKMSEIFSDIKHGRREKGKVRITKFEDVVKKFLKYKKDRVSQRTISDYDRGSDFLLEKFKGKDVQTLCDKSEYEGYKTWRQNYYKDHKNKRIRKYKRNGKVLKSQEYNHVGNVVINREIRLLVSILRYGKEYMGLFKGVDIPSYTTLPEKRRDEILSEEEYKKLRDYWMEKNPFYGHIINFLSNSGVRYPSEINKLKWKDVNFEENTIIIRNRKSKNNTLESVIPMVSSLRNDLNWLRTRKGISTEPEDYVFVDSNGQIVKRIVRSFKTSLSDLGITKNITLYSFRHYYTSQMIKRNDISLVSLSKVLGHSNTNTLQKYYSVVTSKDIVDTFMRSDKKNKVEERQIPDKDHPIRQFFDVDN